MSKICIFVVLMVTILLSGCFNSSQFQTPPPLTTKHAAVIYIMRPTKIFGSPMNAPVYVNNIYIGRVGIGGYLSWRTPPGITSVSTDAGVGSYVFNHKNVPSVLAFNARANKIYYVKLTFPVQVILVTPSFELELLSEKEGKNMISKLKK